MLNRFDDIIVFKNLERGDIEKILELELKQVRQRLAAKGVELRLTKAAAGYLVDRGFDPDHGARPLRRAVERHLEDPLADQLLQATLEEGVIEADLDSDKSKIVFNKVASEKK